LADIKSDDTEYGGLQTALYQDDGLATHNATIKAVAQRVHCIDGWMNGWGSTGEPGAQSLQLAGGFFQPSRSRRVAGSLTERAAADACLGQTSAINITALIIIDQRCTRWTFCTRVA